MRSFYALLCVVGSVVGAPGALATDPAALRCVPSVSAHFGVPALVLELVLELEGGAVGASSRNANGSRDLGPAQINTQHLAHLQKLGIRQPEILAEPCVNLAVAAWHLRRDYDRTPVTAAPSARWSTALLDYHSRTPRFRARYRDRAHALLLRRLRDGARSR